MIQVTKLKIILSFVFILLFSTYILSQDLEESIKSLNFKSNGFNISGIFFPAKGEGPFPTSILLHGYPGKEGDFLDLGKKLSENSINAYTFNYSGTWKSEGIYLPETSLEDV